MTVVATIEQLEAIYGFPNDASTVKVADRVTPAYRALMDKSSFAAPAIPAPTQDTDVGEDVSADEPPAVAASAPAPVSVGQGGITGEAKPPSSAAPPPVPQLAPRTSQPLPDPPTPGRRAPPSAWMEIGSVGC